MFLRQEQGVLLDQLGRRDPLIAEIYAGGLRAFADDTNPYRFQLSAHAFRELIAHCLRMTGEKVVFGDGMKQRLVPVKDAFQALKRTNQLAPGPTSQPSGVSDTLIEALNDFFEWSDNNRGENRKKTALMLTQLAGPGPALPSDVVADEISEWMESDGYFKRVAHNIQRAERDDLVAKLYAVEDILLRRLQPRPVSDLDEIDALIEEGEDAD
ncbi:MAG: hypothetical protein BGO25_15585 [Acidobacteriales bacterium 59-55]|nr:hypothetical protein [Terriglobales bacterium]OJV41174.1 MAG: hypothetical protein BGO25_15585 [Acidobacteriales bacterium 59-55]